jgi:ferritin-like metal-binding protein YciE
VFPVAAVKQKTTIDPNSIMKLLKDLFLDELADIYDAEQRLVKALPKLAQGATCTKLNDAFLAHLQETKGHVTKLEQVFALFGETARGKTCAATVGLLKEGDQLAADFTGSPAINAALISAAQRVEHYEMAAYGTLHEWAGLLGHSEAAAILKTILGEERAANETLKTLARAKCNQEALHEPWSKESEARKAESLREDRASSLV